MRIQVASAIRNRTTFFYHKVLFIYTILHVSVSFPNACMLFAQTLNEAVTNQLDLGPALTSPCFELQNKPGIRTGSLSQICTRPNTFPGGGPSDSTGGESTTPNTLPEILQKRMMGPQNNDNDDNKGDKRNLLFSTLNDGASASATKSTYEMGEEIGFFISSQFEQAKRDITHFENGYDSILWRLTVGGDYRINDQFIAGVAFDYYRQEGDFKNRGVFQTNSYSILGFASIIPFKNTYIQLSGGWGRKDYKRTRFASFIDISASTMQSDTIVEGVIKSDYMANEYQAGILVGYDISFKESGIVSPRLGVNWTRLIFENYSEQGTKTGSLFDFIIFNETGLELTFYDDAQTFFQTRIGIQALYSFASNFGKLVPRICIDWIHEFENDQRNVEVSFVGDSGGNRFIFQTDNPDRDWLNICAGLSLFVSEKFLISADYRTMQMHSFFNSHAGMVTLRYHL